MFCHFNSSRAIILAPVWSDEKGKPSRASGTWAVFHKFVTQIRDQPCVVPGAPAIPAGCHCSRSSLWVINSSTALLDLDGSRWREAKLFPSRGVKLPYLSARSQSFVDVVFRTI
jgi:hypothetical protein